MFSKTIRKTAALFMAVCMVAGLFACLSAIPALAEGTTVSNDRAIFIGKTGSAVQAATFIPVDMILHIASLTGAITAR